MSSKTDFGPPYYKDMLPPVIEKNYGKWLYHERVKPGVLKHVPKQAMNSTQCEWAPAGW